MRSFVVVVVLGVGLGRCEAARGAGPGGRLWPWPWCSPHPACPCCPDDYGRKTLPPCPPQVCGHAPDDYCRKALPRVVPVKCFGQDDYCRKSSRIWLPPCYPPWYICSPPHGGARPQGSCPSVPGPP